MRYLSFVFGDGCRSLLMAHNFKRFPLLARQPRTLVAACGLLVALTAVPTHAQTCAQPPSGLVAWWPLDETAGAKVHDIVGGHDGDTFNNNTSAPIGVGAAALAAIKANTWNGGPVSVPGEVGNSLQFGFDIWARVPDAADLNFGTGDFTIDAWVKYYHYPFSPVGKVIVSKVDNLGGYHLMIGMPGTVDKLQLQMKDGNGGTKNYDGPDITAPLETWIFVAVARTGKTVTLYVNNTSLSVTSPGATPIASNTNPLFIGEGFPYGSDLAIDELEIFNRALTQPEIQGIFNAGSAGKCKREKGMTWIHTKSNDQTGTITVGCGSGSSSCDPYHGDTSCAKLRPLLCIYKPTSPFPLPISEGIGNQYNRWSGGVVATTPPVPGSMFAHISVDPAGPDKDANSYCAKQFGPGWRVAEFHDGAGWNFRAYGGTVDAPTVPSTRFWVHIKDQPAANCWATP